MNVLKDSTPRPWFVNEMDRYVAISNSIEPEVMRHGQKVVAIMGNTPLAPPERENETDRANAALIVLAVNAHERLVLVCAMTLKRLDLEYEERKAAGQSLNFPCAALREDLRAALAAAGA